MNPEQKKRRIRKIKIALLTLFMVLVISIPIFIYFRLTTEGRLALREAKNVNLQLQMLEVEAYAKEISLYNPNTPYGINTEYYERIRNFMGFDFDLKITSYNKSLRQVTGFVYQRGNYQVVYTYDTIKGNDWKVNYLFTILDYDGE